jgi:parvulin-like peptidyl-prolyl isomerase
VSRPEVARVGSVDVGFADLQRAEQLQRSLADLQRIPCGQAVRGETETSACSRQALSAELLWIAVQGFADRHGLGASPQDVERAVAQLEAQVGKGALDDALKAHEVTRDDLNELGRRILTIRKVRLAVALHRVGEARLRSLYQDQALDFTTIQLDQIVVKTEAEARDVYRRVKDGSEARFVALARRVSIEPDAKERGGRRGSAVASTYDPAFARVAVALEPGEVSRPVQTSLGWHVIYLVDKEVTSFADAEPQLVESVADREFRAWLVDRAASLHVEVNPRYGRFIPDTFSIVPVRSTDAEAETGGP